MNFKNIPQTVRVFSIPEAEGLGPLPSAEIKRSGARAGLAKWLAAAAAFLFVIGGTGFWVYSKHQRNNAELAREARLADGKVAAGEARRSTDAERPAAISAAPPATFEPPQIPTGYTQDGGSW